jgi:hypothetical protein
MQSPAGQQSAHKLASKKAATGPEFPILARMPETLEELFRSIAITVSTTFEQPRPEGKSSKQNYSLPWASFTGWRDARARLDHFEKHFKGDITWVPFNDSTSNDGPMSLNAYPGRAFIERVTNEGDANLEAKALSHDGPKPTSPQMAAAEWFGLDAKAMSTGLDDDKLRELAQRTVTVVGFVGDPADPKDSIFDARDYGIGLLASEMPGTILSLNRGNKKSKSWLTGKHGQGASSTYQYSDLTLIASRKIGCNNVAFTFVEARWDADGDAPPKTPTYRYLVIGGKVPEIPLAETEFPAGTLVRHIGYNAGELLSLLGANSLYGLLMRSLASPIFPVWLEIFSLRPGKVSGRPVHSGFRRYGRLIRGSVNALERAWSNTVKGTTDKTEDEEQSDAEPESIEGADTKEKAGGPSKILHQASEYYQLPKWDYGGRTGIGELGKVKMTWWVADPAGRSAQSVVSNWVDPDKTILLTLDGQTHAEESRAIVTGRTGANLWAVGKYMVVQIDCNELDPKAKYEMFTSTREHAKETPIKKMILEELVRRLSFDKKLEELNVKLAAADVKQSGDESETIASLIKKYLKAAGISFDQLTRKVEKWTDFEEEQEVKVRPEKPEPPPIAAVEPPTFVRWKFKGESVKLHPGQRYSFVFETDASPSYWNPADQTASRIKVLAHAISYVGAGDNKAGRVRCHFECPSSMAVGTKGYIQVQLDFTIGASLTHRLPVEIVEKPKKPPYTPKPDKPSSPDEDGAAAKTIKVKVRKKDFSEVEIPVLKPMPVVRADSLWSTLSWPHDPHWVGFSIRSLGGKIQLYYNAEFPPFLDLKHRMSKKSLENEFVRRYELKLVIHTMFSLNYDFADEDDFAEDQKKRVRNLLCATAESLALATKSELEIESKLKSEDGVPLESMVAANLQGNTELAVPETAQ